MRAQGPGQLFGAAAAAVLALPALSQEAEDGDKPLEARSIVTLQEAMTGATAMSVIAGAYLFIARPDGGYVCAINLNDKFFPSLREGAGKSAFENQPGALCVTARMFEDLSRRDQKKL